MRFDPLLIKLGIFALVFVVKTVSSMNNKRKKNNDRLRPPQSASGPAPIASPTTDQRQSPPTMNQPPMPRTPNSPKGKSSGDGSPWSSSQNPFD